MEKNDDDLLVRRRRVNEDGEWEYECNVCLNWLAKDRFRGCKVYVDAYGNCLMCSSCRSRKSTETKVSGEQREVKRILTALGFYNYASSEEWFRERHKKFKGYYPAITEQKKEGK
jgi:hypothetical protein